MKKISFLIFVMCLAVASTAWAESINERQARDIAAGFMASRNGGSPSLKMTRKALQPGESSSGKAAYYVFNASGGGYVIVAGDDRAPAVLGYSEAGAFDTQTVPEAMQELLESYALQMQALGQGMKAAPQLSAGKAIAPLVHAAWSQNSPYNNLLPFINGKHAVVGCVATAMAQVMHYWQWPAKATQTIPAYTSTALSIAMPALSPVNFNWSAMQDTYETYDTTSTAALAAARLSLYCAQSVEMNFKDGTSSATGTRIPLALSTYFGYRPSVHSMNRVNYTNQQWNDALYAELAAGRPIIISASKKSSGHAFICDGYDGNGLFHINWGWNGQSNGFFLLNVLNPDMQGTGSATGAYGYIYNQAAIVGIEPGTSGTNEVEITSAMVTLDSYTATRSGSSYNFSATVSGRFYNYTSGVIAVNYGWGLYQGTTLKSTLYNGYNTSLKPGSYLSSSSRVLNFGSGLTSGTYRIVPMYSEYGANNWKPCVGGDMNYIEVTINGNTCTFKGHGTAGERNYTVNGITTEGTLHNGRPVDINVNLTNNGESRNELLHMFVNGTFTASGFVGLEKGETGNVPYRYLPDAAGTYTLTFSWNEDGSSPIATRQLNITAMPEANLSGTLELLNVTDVAGRVITSDKFSVKLTITNKGTTTYDEEISVKLYKHSYGNYGNTVEGKSQRIVLAPGASTTLQFDMANVIDGWRYFVKTYYYSNGSQADLVSSSKYTIVFPTAPEYVPGDADGNGEVDIADVTALIDHLLNGNAIDTLAADMDQDGDVSISDVSALIDYLLSR